jgi:hypothetical protein
MRQADEDSDSREYEEALRRSLEDKAQWAERRQKGIKSALRAGIPGPVRWPGITTYKTALNCILLVLIIPKIDTFWLTV